MKIVLKTLYAVLLVFAGLLLIRIIFGLSGVENTNMFVATIHSVTNIIVVPFRWLVYGDLKPGAVISQGSGGIEPVEIFSLFIVLILAFVVTAGAHALDHRREVIVAPKK